MKNDVVDVDRNDDLTGNRGDENHWFDGLLSISCNNFAKADILKYSVIGSIANWHALMNKDLAQWSVFCEKSLMKFISSLNCIVSFFPYNFGSKLNYER